MGLLDWLEAMEVIWLVYVWLGGLFLVALVLCLFAKDKHE